MTNAIRARAVERLGEPRMLIGGDWCAADGGATLPSVDPATEQ